VADGLESLTDVLSGLVVYFGLKIAVKPPDADHPYGHGKAEPIAAVVVSLALMAAAFGIIYEGIREIIAPHPGVLVHVEPEEEFTIKSGLKRTVS
jgi:divalent metal cation (Fe/Co/Zn/Cd) transporter